MHVGICVRAIIRALKNLTIGTAEVLECQSGRRISSLHVHGRGGRLTLQKLGSDLVGSSGIFF